MTQQDTVVITGSSGFLGQALAARLLERYRIIGLDFGQPKEALPGMRTIEVHLTSAESAREAVDTAAELAGGRIAPVVHPAGDSDLSGDPLPTYESVPVCGTPRTPASPPRLRTQTLVCASTVLSPKRIPRGAT